MWNRTGIIVAHQYIRRRNDVTTGEFRLAAQRFLSWKADSRRLGAASQGSTLLVRRIDATVLQRVTLQCPK
jgi:hypothetical protein